MFLYRVILPLKELNIVSPNEHKAKEAAIEIFNNGSDVEGTVDESNILSCTMVIEIDKVVL